MTKYVIQSKLNKKYLSHLFEDSHNKTFQESEPTKGKVYFWDNKETAEYIASKENGKVISIEY